MKKKMIEKPEIQVVKIESVDICTASVAAENTGATMSTSMGYTVTGMSFE